MRQNYGNIMVKLVISVCHAYKLSGPAKAPALGDGLLKFKRKEGYNAPFFSFHFNF